MNRDFDYRVHASCIGIAYLYPKSENPFFKQGRGEVYRVARKMCSGCPVVVDCLVDNLEEDIGFFGGCSVTERTHIRRDMKLGVSFAESAEKIWSHQRNGGSDNAPPKSVWKEWEV